MGEETNPEKLLRLRAEAYGLMKQLEFLRARLQEVEKMIEETTENNYKTCVDQWCNGTGDKEINVTN